ncbi:hypothetical protein D3C87_1396750 [compost metagenome]
MADLQAVELILAQVEGDPRVIQIDHGEDRHPDQHQFAGVGEAFGDLARRWRNQTGFGLQRGHLADAGAGGRDLGVGDGLLFAAGSGDGFQILLASSLGLGGGGGAGGVGLVATLGRDDALGVQVFSPPRGLGGQLGRGLGAAPDGFQRADVLGPGADAAEFLNRLGALQGGGGLLVPGGDLGAGEDGENLALGDTVARRGQNLLDAGRGLGRDGECLGLDHALHLRRGRAGGQEQADDDEDQHGQRRDADQQGLDRRTAAPTGRRRDWISGGCGLGHGAITRSARCR